MINKKINNNEFNNSRYDDKDFDNIPDYIDSCFDPPSLKETEIADEKKLEDVKKSKVNLLTR